MAATVTVAVGGTTSSSVTLKIPVRSLVRVFVRANRHTYFHAYVHCGTYLRATN